MLLWYEIALSCIEEIIVILVRVAQKTRMGLASPLESIVQPLPITDDAILRYYTLGAYHKSDLSSESDPRRHRACLLFFGC